MSDGAVIEKKFHRVRFYKDGWSNFDEIKECDKPQWCWGCGYKHPFCTRNGRVISPPPESK